MNPIEPPLPLRMLPAGQLALISDLVGLPEHIHRLEEMGLRRGAYIEIVQAGSPCILRLGDQRLCLRDTDAMGVLVQRSAAR